MRFWFSGEVHASVSESYRLAMNALEGALNRRGGDATISPALDQIAYLAIMLPDGWGDYPEVKRYSKKKRTLECRLKIDCESFAAANRARRFGLLQDSLMRVADIAAAKDIPFDRTKYLGILHESISDAKRANQAPEPTR